VLQLPWPSPPEEGQHTLWQQQGELFHQFVAQYYMKVPVEQLDLSLMPPEVQGWWHTFLRQPPVDPQRGRSLVETTLTMPAGEWQLIGRFDLLQMTANAVQIFDWKTGRARSAAELTDDWQTRLYMALVWGGHRALGVEQLNALDIEMTYWYARQPQQSVTLRFDQLWHKQNLAKIGQIVSEISQMIAANQSIWPLTDDLRECAACSFRNYCGRFEAEALVDKLLRESDEEFHEPVLEEIWEEEQLMEPGDNN
jgi:hypothetical protein